MKISRILHVRRYIRIQPLSFLYTPHSPSVFHPVSRRRGRLRLRPRYYFAVAVFPFIGAAARVAIVARRRRRKNRVDNFLVDVLRGARG